LQKGESPDEWVEKLETIRTTIEQIMGKLHIDNDNMMLHIIDNIPKNYDIIVDRVTRELSNKTLTIESLLEDLKEKFERMKAKKNTTKAKHHSMPSKSKQDVICVARLDIRRRIIVKMKTTRTSGQRDEEKLSI
jgi:hypothetical protein